MEIVRCKDCKHRPVVVDKEHPYGFGVDPPKIEDSEFDDWDCPYLCSDPYYNIMPKDDWFCHRGEANNG